ncbi:hypothetical protein [Thiofilum flexile]|uniref:hypothetical protein n=1 Tax=Thiofilum flexile TaxID=125627 RepID=UPI000361B3CD|nr:hypothetical protein [Thiofilum flexile]
MNADRDAWYRSRILWKASQHKLLDKKCYKFSDLPENEASLIQNMLPSSVNPVIVFWENQDKWTVLGTRIVASFYQGNLVLAELDKINKQISVVLPKNSDPKNIKREASFLRLDALDTLIWAPAGSELFALMNILQMFPLVKKIDLL